MNIDIDRTMANAMKGYLRTCSAGGIPQEEIDLIVTHVDQAAKLHYFATAFATAQHEERQGAL